MELHYSRISFRVAAMGLLIVLSLALVCGGVGCGGAYHRLQGAGVGQGSVGERGSVGHPFKQVMPVRVEVHDPEQLAQINELELGEIVFDRRTRAGVPSEEQLREIVRSAFRARVTGVRFSGKESGSADGQLRVRLITYEERKGGRLGSGDPAAVGFTVEVFPLPEQRGGESPVWEAHYAYRERPFAENLLERSGAGNRKGFDTVDALFRQGLEETFDRLSADRVEQYTGTHHP